MSSSAEEKKSKKRVSRKSRHVGLYADDAGCVPELFFVRFFGKDGNCLFLTWAIISPGRFSLARWLLGAAGLELWNEKGRDAPYCYGSGEVLVFVGDAST